MDSTSIRLLTCTLAGPELIPCLDLARYGTLLAVEDPTLRPGLGYAIGATYVGQLCRWCPFCGVEIGRQRGRL